jgi:hypothetical protein
MTNELQHIKEQLAVLTAAVNRLAEVTAQRDALGPLAEGLLNDENQYCFTDEQALAARATLAAIAAERGNGER